MGSIDQEIKKLKIQGIIKNEQEDGVINELQKVAKPFLQAVNNLLINYNKIQTKTKLGDLAYEIANYTKQELELVRSVYAQINNFEIALNAIFGKVEFLTFVDEATGELLFIDDVHTGQLYKEAIHQKSAGGGGKFPVFNTILKYVSGMPQKYKDVEQAIAKSHALRQNVYLHIIARYQHSLKNPPETESGKKFSDPTKVGFIYKNINRSRKKFMDHAIGNKGIIAEGYARAVIEEDKEIQNFGGPYDSDFENGLWKLATVYAVKDSKPGSVEGDIVKHNFHFGIKKSGADLARIPQYVRLAESIMLISSDSALTAELYHVILPKIVNAHSNSKDSVNQIIAAASKTSIEQIKTELTKINKKDFNFA